MESAIGQLLAMSDPAAAAREEAAVESSASDEELAMALFKQFAEELENQLDTPIPPEARDHRFAHAHARALYLAPARSDRWDVGK
eukprot:4051185-Pleurochrysis_carterae.AAC.1